MFCPQCGMQIPDQSKFCPGCGATLTDEVKSAVQQPQSFEQPAQPQTYAQPYDQQAYAQQQTYAQQQAYAQPGYDPYAAPVAVQTRKKKSKKPLFITIGALVAVAALVVGAWLLFFR